MKLDNERIEWVEQFVQVAGGAAVGAWAARSTPVFDSLSANIALIAIVTGSVVVAVIYGVDKVSKNAS